MKSSYWERTGRVVMTGLSLAGKVDSTPFFSPAGLARPGALGRIAPFQTTRGTPGHEPRHRRPSARLRHRLPRPRRRGIPALRTDRAHAGEASRRDKGVREDQQEEG